MRIHIDKLCFNTILGLLPHERITPQQICIDMELEYNYNNGNFIDYAKIAQEVENHVSATGYELLEDAIEGVEALCISLYPNIKHLYIKISKPQILQSCIVSVSKSSIF